MADVPRLSGPFRNLRLAEDYGVKADGSTDDFAALNRAIAQTPVGGVCRLPAGTIMTSGPIIVPPGKSIEGTHSQTLSYTNALAAPALIKPTSGFSGTAVIRLIDKTIGGYATDAIGSRIRYLMVDGSGGPASVKGVQVSGYVREALFYEVTVRSTTDNGFDLVPVDGRRPMSLRLHHCVADNCNGAGFGVQAADTTLIDCNAQGSGWIGFYLAGAMNGVAIGCRAEWSGSHGFGLMYGDWGSGQGSGGFALIGCITDRNNQNGVYISATGTAPITMTGCQHRRDGRNNKNGGGSFAAVFVDTAATMPVTIDGVTVFPGLDDDGTGTNSPQIGISALGSSPVTVSSGYVHAATTPFALSSTNIAASEIGTATGTTANPVRTPGSVPGGSTPTVRDIGNISGTITPSVLTSTGTMRGVMTDAVSVAGVSGMYDGQRILFEFQASGAARVLTFGAAFETTQVVPSRIITVPSGTWGSALIENRAGTLVLISATPQLTASVDTQIFETAGSATWTKPPGAKIVQVTCIGGGGGGGSGACVASGSAASGGAGGGGGGYSTVIFPASQLNATESLTVGAGGAGGTARSSASSSTAGVTGTTGSISVFGSPIRTRAGGGGGGAGGALGAAATGGASSAGTVASGNGGGGVSGAAGSAGLTTQLSPSGGGAGGGVTTAPAATAGGAGGTPQLVLGTTASAGAAAGGTGGTGPNHTGSYIGGGGGGGGSRISGGAAGNGGPGGNDGGGGGGGGSVINGQASGAGGAGATGMIIVITYF